MKRSEVVNFVTSLEGEEGHQKVINLYNSQCPLPRGYKLQQSDPWCAATVVAVLLMCKYKDIAKLADCSCIMMIKNARDLGIWVEDDAYVPKVGDIIMYDWNDSGQGDNLGTPDHTGIVIQVDKNKIIVREGNKNGTLGNRDVVVNQAKIRGYITPEFEEEEMESDLIRHYLPEISYGSKGKAVAVWQIIADAIPDGVFGTETKKATEVFQRDHGLSVDGIVGDMTWNEGLKTL